MERNILHYRIIEKLGQGGMGVVYKAEDTSLKRTVALKFLPENLLPEEHDRKRFIKEAQAAASLDHPNICAVHEIEEAEGRLFITMAYCDGVTLKEKIDEGPLDPAEAIDLMIQIAEGLGEAHEKGVIHRDIKPGNIMVDAKHHAKIMDFGLAKVTSETSRTRSTRTAGTVAYMSPELIKGERTDRRTDIWSLGIVLYQALTGTLPFMGDYTAAVLYSIVNEKLPPPRRINTNIPEELDEVIQKALKKDPVERYQSMEEMILDLKRIREPHPSAEAPSIPRIKPGARLKPLHGAAIALAVALLVCIALIALYKWRPWEDGGDRIPLRIAVLELVNKTDDRHLGKNVSARLLNYLKNNRLIATYDFYVMSQEFNDAGIGQTDQSAALDLFLRKNIQILVAGEITRENNTFTIDVTARDIKTRKEKSSISVQGDDLDSIISDLCKKLETELNLVPAEDIDALTRLPGGDTKDIVAFTLWRSGLSSYNGGDPKKGIADIKMAVQKDSTFVNACQHLAIWYSYVPDTARAVAYAKQALRHSGHDANEYRQSQIALCRARHKWREAATNMKSYLSTHPKDIKMNLDLGYVLYRYLKEYEDAIHYIKKIPELDPHNLEGYLPKAYNSLGHAHLYAHHNEKALAALEMYRTHLPDEIDPINSLAYAYRHIGRHHRAIELLDSLTTIVEESDYPFNYDELGLNYIEIGKWKDAIEALERYIVDALDTKKIDGHIYIATVHFIQENEDALHTQLARALEIDPLSLAAYWLRGKTALAYHQDGESARAALATMQHITDTRREDWDFAYYYGLMGAVLIAEGEHDRGIDALREAIRVSAPNLYIFEKELIRGYLAAGRYHEAIEEADRFLSFHRNNGEAFYLKGLTFEKMGRASDARESYRAAKASWELADEDFRPYIHVLSKLDEFTGS